MPKARLGQNFLVDQGAARKIVEALGDLRKSVVVEIGPGRGALTRLLGQRADRVIAVELDAGLAARLREEFGDLKNVEIVQANILDVDIAALVGPQAHGERVKLVGNIPYYITSDILLQAFEQHEAISNMVLMVQKEVADRLSAEPGTRDYGVLTVTAQLFADVETLFTLPPRAFAPPPKVYSSVIRLRIRSKAAELTVGVDEFLKFCKLAFAQKRKTLFNNLRRRYSTLEIRETLKAAGVREDIRAEALSLSALALIYRALHRACR
jgi:16S rRNA (adenine1518-N6/adenine1519-N6)-dimethyltransferase